MGIKLQNRTVNIGDIIFLKTTDPYNNENLKNLIGDIFIVKEIDEHLPTIIGIYNLTKNRPGWFNRNRFRKATKRDFIKLVASSRKVNIVKENKFYILNREFSDNINFKTGDILQIETVGYLYPDGVLAKIPFQKFSNKISRILVYKKDLNDINVTVFK